MRALEGSEKRVPVILARAPAPMLHCRGPGPTSPGSIHSAHRQRSWAACRKAGVRRGSPMSIDYEVTYILRPNLEENEVGERTSAFAELLKTQGGEVLNLETLGKKRLAYELNDVREGIYAVMRFRSEAPAAHELERQLGLNEDVMRALLIKLDKHAIAAEKAAVTAQA